MEQIIHVVIHILCKLEWIKKKSKIIIIAIAMLNNKSLTTQFSIWFLEILPFFSSPPSNLTNFHSNYSYEIVSFSAFCPFRFSTFLSPNFHRSLNIQCY